MPLLTLADNEVHLWVVLPEKIRQTGWLERYRSLLAPDELRRQQSYVFAEKRHIALVTRAFVRDVLSHYAERSPENWCFETNPFGKPEIVEPPLPLRFNLSHCDDCVICAVALNDEIGCDVEALDGCDDYLGIAERYFTPCEYSQLLSLSGRVRRERFFGLWTLKESCIKASGLGLSMPLDDFAVTIGKAKSPQYNGNIQLRFAPHRAERRGAWRGWLFQPDDRHRVAVSLRSFTDIRLRRYVFRYFESLPLFKTEEMNVFCF